MPKQIKKQGKNKKSIKYVVTIMANFTWMFVLYRLMIMLGQNLRSLIPYAITSSIYLAAAAILLGIYYFCSQGEADSAKKEKYKSLFLWALPIILVLLLDVLETIVLDNIINLFK